MLCTINTDASFNKRTSTGTYAFWSKSSTFTIKRSGILRGKIVSSCEAELKTIINAIKFTLDAEAEVTRLIINTDSMNAIYILTDSKNEIRRYKLYWGHKAKSVYNEILKSFPCVKQIEFRHVQAHSGIKDARSYVNEWCDTMAKKEMEKFFQKRKK